MSFVFIGLFLHVYVIRFARSVNHSYPLLYMITLHHGCDCNECSGNQMMEGKGRESEETHRTSLFG